MLDFTKTIATDNVKDVINASKKAKAKVKTERFFLRLFILICILVIALCLCLLFKRQKINNYNNEISKLVYDVSDMKEITLDNVLSKNGESLKSFDLYNDFKNLNVVDVNFTDLIQMNNDVKGWIKVSGTNINYPFVQQSDNNYYLKHSLDNSVNKNGWVFLDFRNDINHLSKNNIIYAHGLVNNNMFGSMRKIFKKDWYNNKENHIIKFTTLYNYQLWQVFSCYTVEPESYYITTSFNDDNDFQKFIDTITQRSVYDFNVDVGVSDKIITLSSCYDNSKRMVMHAKLIGSFSK